VLLKAPFVTGIDANVKAGGRAAEVLQQSFSLHGTERGAILMATHVDEK
jgi:hypothetical protein